MQLITERKHSPLTDYSDEVRNLYNFINSELKKKKKNEDFITYTLNIENIDVPVQEYSIKIDDLAEFTRDMVRKEKVLSI